MISDLLENIQDLEKENKRLRDFLLSIQYETAVLGGKKRDLEKALNEIDCLCDWALRPEEMFIEEIAENIKRNLQSVSTTTTETISDNLKNVATWGENK